MIDDENKDKVREIAQKLNLSRQTVRNQLSVGLKALRRSLLLILLHRVGVLDLALGKPLLDQLVFGRENHVRRAEKRVATGRVDGYQIGRLFGLFDCSIVTAEADPEVDERTGRLADPVALHLLDAVGPVERVEILEETLGVLGDLEHPLAHGLADDRMVAALGASVNDLLVRQDRTEGGTPVHRHFGNIGEALLVELLEDPLRPLVVLRIRRIDLAVPVVAEAVPAHWMEDVKAPHALVAAEDVRRRVPLGMPHVKPGARRIRKHVEAVELLALAVRVRLEGLVFEPVLLPLLLDGREIIVAHATSRPRRVRRSILRSDRKRRWSPQRRRL